jgi:hypothetical protein
MGMEVGWRTRKRKDIYIYIDLLQKYLKQKSKLP